MKLVRRFSTLVVLSAFAVGCAPSNDGNSNATPTSPEEALKALPEENRQALGAWASKLLKTCSAAEAMTGSGSSARSTTNLVDVGAVVAKLGGTALVKNGAGRFAILGTPVAPSGVGESRFKVETEINGRKQVVEASTKSSGSTCELYLYGQKVHETRLATQLTVAGAWTVSKVAHSSQPERLGNSSGGSVASMSGLGFREAFLLALHPDANDLAFVGSAIGLDSEQSKSLIASGNVGSLSATFDFGNRDLLTFSSDDTDIYGSPMAINGIGTQSSSRLIVLLKQDWLKSNVGAESNAPMKFEVEMRAIASGVDQRSYRTIALTSVPSENYSDEKAVRCFRSRVEMISKTGSTGYVNPSSSKAFAGCDGYSSNLSEAIYQSAEARAIVAKIAMRMSPSKQGYNAGWDGLVISWAERTQKEGKALRETLDPQGDRPSIYEASLNQSSMMIAEAANYPRISASPSELVRAGFSWAMRDEQVSRQRLLQIFTAVENIKGDLPETANALWFNLMSNPNGFTDELIYATSLNETDRKNLAAVRQIAVSLEQDAFVRMHLGDILKTRPSREQVVLWRASADAASEFSARDLARVKEGSEYLHKTRKRDLIGRALSEGWTAETFQGAETLAQINGFDFSCRNYTDVSSLADCRYSDRYSNRGRGMLKPEQGGRYVVMARLLVEQLKRAVQDQNKTTFADSISDEFFGPIWQNCSGNDFADRANNFIRTVGAWASEQDWFKQNELQRAARDQMRAACR